MQPKGIFANRNNGRKKEVFFLRLCRQPLDEFYEFCKDLNFLVSNIKNQNISLSVIAGDCNASSLKWWSIDKENAKGRGIYL